MFASLWGVEGRDKRECGIFGHISDDMRRSARFCQLISIGSARDIGLKVVRSMRIRVGSKSPTWIGDR